jgi:hypothetical protein
LAVFGGVFGEKAGGGCGRHKLPLRASVLPTLKEKKKKSDPDAGQNTTTVHPGFDY